MTESGTNSGYTGTASGEFIADFGGLHFSGSAEANNTAALSEATLSLRMLDYFVVTGAPSGSFLMFNYGADATGSTLFDSLGFLQYGTAFGVSSQTIRSSDGTTAMLACIPSNNPGQMIYINGAVSKSCTQSVALSSSSDVVRFGLFTSGFAIANNGSTVLDATNTVLLNSVEVVDPSGNILPSVQIDDLSGFDYNASGAGAPTPEPQSMLMLTSGIIMLWFIRRRTGKTSSPSRM